MNKLLITITLLCFSVGANAQLDENFKNFLKVTDPNELPYWYSHQDECPWTEPEAEQIIEGVIKRSRIRTRHSINEVSGIYLNVKTICMDVGDNLGYATFFQIEYGAYPMLYEKSYGGLLTGGSDSKSYFLDRLQTSIEDAITDFVEVNFLSDSN